MAPKTKNKKPPKKQGRAGTANNGTPRLIFPPGNIAGFTPANLSISRDKEAPGIVREILQNSLDAASEAERDCAEVDFSLEDVPIRDIPGIDEYRKAVEGCAAFCEKRGWQGQDKQVINTLRGSLRKKTLPVLFVTDNGVGFDSDRLSAILSDGINHKASEGSSGSHGNGHFTVFNLSVLRYLLYGGVSASGMLGSGQTILCSHQGEKGPCGGNGYLVSRMNKDVNRPYAFASDAHCIPPLIMGKLQHIKSAHKTGALLAVLDFNFFGEDNNSENHTADLILGAAARNFFVAIHRGNLEISVKIGGAESRLNSGNLAAVMNEIASQLGNVRNFPRQDTAQRFYTLFSDCKQGKDNARIDEAKTESGSLKIYYRQGQVSTTDIAFCRNGMWITKDIPYVKAKVFGEYAPFEALILCDANPDEQLPRLIRAAETNLHNALTMNEVEDKDDAAQLRRALMATRKRFEELINKQDSEEIDFNFNVDCVGPMDDTPGRRTLKKGERIGPGDQPPPGLRPAGLLIIPPSPNPEPPEPTPTPPNPKPRKPGRGLRVRCVAVRNNNKMNIRIVSLATSSDVELRLALSGGSDFSCDNPNSENSHINLTSVKCDGEECPVTNGTARIGEVAEGDEKRIEVEFDAPGVKDDNYKVDCEFVHRAPLS